MIWIIHSSLLAIALFATYWLLFKSKHSFQLNRFFLLSIPIISVLLPVISLPLPAEWQLQYEEPKVNNVSSVLLKTPNLTAQGLNVMLKPENSGFTQIDWWLLIYGLGVVVSLVILLVKLIQILKIKASARVIKVRSSYVHLVAKKDCAFSFCNWIILSDDLDDVTIQKITTHEKIHCRQLHNYDLLYMEAFKVLFWFHPVVYLIQKQVRAQHEFIVDQKLTNDYPNYVQDLLDHRFDHPVSSLIATYNHSSLLKQRIAMLTTTPSTQNIITRIAVIIVLLTGSLFYTACTDEIEVRPTLATNEFADETVIINGIELPTLRGFVYGQKDYYNGVTSSEMVIYSQGPSIINRISNHGSSDPQILSEQQYLAFEALTEVEKKIKGNSSTLVVDTENNNDLIVITEYPKQELTYTGWPLEVQQKMTNEEYRDFVMTILSQIKQGKGLEMVTLRNKTIQQRNENTGGSNANGIDVVEIEDLIGEQQEEKAVGLSSLHQLPSFPGCQASTREESRVCTSTEVAKFFNKNFNTRLINSLDSGSYKINVQFIIDKKGNVRDIKAKSRNNLLKAEAIRVAALLPRFKPGEINGKPVRVVYSLPITSVKP